MTRQLIKERLMRSIKLSFTHVLQAHHPSVSDIDADELKAAVHVAINENLDSQADDLNNMAIQFDDSDDDQNLDEDSDDDSELDEEESE